MLWEDGQVVSVICVWTQCGHNADIFRSELCLNLNKQGMKIQISN